MAERADVANPPAATAVRRERVLIVEDDPGVARLEEMYLRRAGFEVVVAGTADAGLGAIRLGGIDLIVLDQNLQGGLTGLDFYEQIAAEGERTPAILVTGLNDESTLIRALRCGLSDFVPKTTDYLDDLIAAVERVVSQLRTRRRLAESEERLAGVTLLAETIPQIVWRARPDGFVEYFNRRWAETTGLAPESSLGWNWFRALHPDDLDRVAGAWSRSLASGEPFEAEFRLRRAGDGAYRWFLGRCQLVRDESGRITKWFGTSTDIDDRKRHEHELKRAHELAETASRAKDQFLAMLSHELRTPLTPALLAATAAVGDPETPEPLRRTFEEIRQNLELEARLIDDLLDVMRIVRGKMPYHFEEVSARSLIEKAVEICRSDIEAKRLDLVVDLRAEGDRVLADAARLQQVFWNLIKNAVKFTPEGGSVAIRSRDQGARIAIEVSDTGIGIDPGHLPNIFRAFEQGEDAITRRFGGLGLGLAISRSIVEGHGGTLSASSEGRGRGSTFALEMATVATAAEPEPAGARPPTPSLAEEPEPAECRVLLVEDDPMTARIMAKLLRDNGYVVATANSVSGALAVPADLYDLVVSDIGLPDGTGLDLLRTIRAGRDVPGIALTGFGMEDDIRRSREAGFGAHITKPIDFAKLDAMIRKVAAGRRSAPA